MDIETAATSLQEHLADDTVFTVEVQDTELVVIVNFFYRIEEVPKEWLGFKVKLKHDTLE